ncbi:MAG: GNAT family N-acetyltransferase [Actinomycetota bacterium]
MSQSELITPTAPLEGEVTIDLRNTAPGLSVELIGPGEGTAARLFCLETIREVFGLEYRADWHADLDALEQPEHLYSPSQGGAFLVARRNGVIIGTAGLRPLTSSDKFTSRFADRYPAPEEVGSVWRTYLEPSERSKGFGAELMVDLEKRASELGYRRLYLHTSRLSPRSVSFWKRQGYAEFVNDLDAEATVHLDKTIS